MSSVGPVSPVLRSLLDQACEKSPEYGGGLSNHLPMVLLSLAALGASSQRLTAFADSWLPRLEPFPAGGVSVDVSNWTKFLGDRSALPGLLEHFSGSIAKSSTAAVLGEVLPALWPGIGAGGFHGLLRTAYGVRFGDDLEVAHGLAYWAAAFLPLGTPAESAPRTADPIDFLAALRGTHSLPTGRKAGELISEQMRQASELPALAATASSLRLEPQTLARITSAMVWLYIGTGGFTALHAVTATHAYRVLEPFDLPQRSGLRYLWQALTAAYVSIGAPDIQLARNSGVIPPWEVILEKLSDSLDAHDIKLTDVALQEESFYGDSAFRFAAARRLKLI